MNCALKLSHIIELNDKLAKIRKKGWTETGK